MHTKCELCTIYNLAKTYRSKFREFFMKVQNLTTQVLSYIRNRIITGDLAPGKKLNENELASHLEISRHPIREAFRVLESEHLVYSIPNKGAFVTELSHDDLLEVCQAREMIECHAVELLKKQKIRAFPQLEAAIEDATNLSAPVSDDPEQYLKFHKAFTTFHSKLIQASGNSRLVNFNRAIALNLARYQFKSLQIPGSLVIDSQEHWQILKALQQAHYEKAKKILRHHITKRLQGASKIDL
jgi:DNA-binding GntR family transcriptional regulator